MQLETDTTITMDDCRKAGHCASGVRRWFNEQGIDFRQLMRQGTSANGMLATGDAQGIGVVAHTLARRIAHLDLEGQLIHIDDCRYFKSGADSFPDLMTRAGLSFHSFCEGGIPAAEMMASGDPEAIHIVTQVMRARDGQE